jgi:chemotaxis signal transduction protein
MKLFSFKIHDEILGMEAKYVYRVLDEVKITKVCGMPPCYLGLMYYRGELFDVIDLGKLLKKGRSTFKEGGRIVILRWSDKKLALAPGTINGLIWSEKDSEANTFFTREGHAVRLVTPDRIWKKLLEMQYGPIQI